MAETMTVRQATMALLREHGMTTVFGNPGSTELGFLDRWPNDIRYVLGLQEASVVAMADGFARATGRPALCNLHSAAGVGHALGNVFTAFRNQAPVVITAGQQARGLLPGNPFLGATEAASFPKPYVKWSCEPARAEDVPAALAHAVHLAAQRPQGPTFVSIPSDDWQAPTRPLPPRRVSQDVAPDPALLADCAQALAAARNPVLVIGPEVDAEGAGDAAVALAEKLCAPVWASPFSARLSFPEDHALFAGHLAAAPPAVSNALAAHDLVLVLGAPVFTFHVAGDCALFRDGTPIWQVTPDAEALAAAGAGTGIQASLRLALPALAALLPPTDRAPAPPRARPAPPPAARPIAAEYLFHALSRLLPEDAVVVEEAPSHRPALQRHLPIRRWGGFYTMASGGLGYSLPAAVGVSLAHPGRRVCAIIGDGSMMYSIQALWTAAQHALPLTTIVVNNGGYGAMRSFSRVLGTEGVPGIDLPGIDFVALARGMGCAGLRVEDPAHLPDALAAALRHAAPMVLDVAVDAAIPTLYHKG
ncbi:benzoylformate decarboxylase [Paracraurococcus ruber]|uniref:benzoylformate decarboxylase n=2 Tax=Paracraurococcus ruber TaxID=77675 RepID=UPI001057DB2B|nr:benzoylformate decarboxylase [Paracraurococcus ruber]TDG31403.1 benzoylformate decarboxylase [Paracraurococcus ruber]